MDWSRDDVFHHFCLLTKTISLATFTAALLFSCKPNPSTIDSSDHGQTTTLSRTLAQHHGSTSQYALYLSSANQQGKYQFEICQDSALSNLLDQICTPALFNESGDSFTFSLKKIPVEGHANSESCPEVGQTASSSNCLLLSDATALLGDMINNFTLDHSSKILTIRSNLPNLMTIIRLSTEMILSVTTDDSEEGELIEELSSRKKVAFGGKWTPGGTLEKDTSLQVTLNQMTGHLNAMVVADTRTDTTYVVSACGNGSDHNFCHNSNM